MLRLSHATPSLCLSLCLLRDGKDRTALGLNKTQPSAPLPSVNKPQINLSSLIKNCLPGDFCVIPITSDASRDVVTRSFFSFRVLKEAQERDERGGKKGRDLLWDETASCFLCWVREIFLTFPETLLCFGSVFKLILSPKKSTE